MGTDKSRDHYQGIVIEDPRISTWADETTASQAGPRPGVPEPLNQTGMSLQTSGTQSPDRDLRVRTQRGGFAEPDGAGFVWRNAGDAEWRGYDIPGTITHFESLKWSDLTAPIQWFVQPHAVTLKDRSILVAFYERDDNEALPFAVTVGKRSGGWSYTRVNETATQPTVGLCEFHPCLLVLPSGRVLLYHWVQDLSRNEAQVRMWFSDDDGVTWSIGADAVLDNPVSLDPGADGYHVRRLRVCYGAGQILMLCHLRSNNGSMNAQDVVRQYASSDDGNSFDSIEEWNGIDEDNRGGWPDISYTGGHFIVAYIESGRPSPYKSGQCKYFRLGNAYQPSTNVNHTRMTLGPAFGTFDSSSSPFITDGDLALGSTSDGALYLAGRAVDTPFTSYEEQSACFMYRSDDFGLTWEPVGQFSGFGGLTGLVGCWYNANTLTTCPTAFCLTESEGRLAAVHNWKANPGASASTPTEPSLGISYLGGSSTVTLPGYQRFQTGYRRVNFEDTWLPFDLPPVTPTRWSSGWSAAGAGFASLLDGALRLGDGAPSDRVYTSSGLPAGHNISQGIILHASLEVQSGGSAIADQIGVGVQLSDASDGYGVVARIAPNEVHFIDTVSSSVIAVAPVPSAPPGIDILLAMAGSSFAAWVRPRGDSSDRSWFPVPPTSGLNNSGGGGASSVSWGHLVASGSVSDWYTVQMVTGPYTGLQLAQGSVNPNDLMPHPYSSTGTYVDDGVTVRATDGTTIRADEWKIVTRYDFGVSNLLDPNPRKVWRSTGLTGEAIAFKASDVGNTSLQSDLIAVAVFNCNWPAAVFEGYDATTGTWVALSNVFLFTGMTPLSYNRDGNSVSPSAAGVPAPLIYAGEFENALWSFGSSSGHRVASHLTGKWSNANTRPVDIVLDGIDGTEPASGAGILSSRSGVFICHLQGSKYQGFRLSMVPPSPWTPAMSDSFFEMGRVLIGPVVVHGDRTAWGRVIESSSGTELQEARDRTTRSKRVAPTRRVIEYGWTDAVDTTDGINPAGDADPDFVMPDAGGSSQAVALKAVAPFDFDGVFHLLAGPDKQVVYLPRIENLDGLTLSEPLVRKHQHVLCRITSPVKLESVQGEESDTEVIRVANVTFTEDV